MKNHCYITLPPVIFLSTWIHHFQANTLNSLIHYRYFPEKHILGIFYFNNPDFEFKTRKNALI